MTNELANYKQTEQVNNNVAEYDNMQELQKMNSDPEDCVICIKCNQWFSGVQKLENHDRVVHSNEKPYNCGDCGIMFAQVNSLKKHQESHVEKVWKIKFKECSSELQKEEQEFQCKVSKKTFMQKSDLGSHDVLHSKEKLSSNEICKTSLKTKPHLKVDLKGNDKDKPFKCKLCSKSFTQKGTLTLHYRIHSGNKLFTCNICDRSFTQNIRLIEHHRTHSGEKPFKCKVCGKGFSQNGTLNLHYRVHSEDRPFKCDVCDKAFKQKIHFKEHYRMHSGEKPFECTICKKAFSRRNVFKKHLNIHSKATNM